MLEVTKHLFVCKNIHGKNIEAEISEIFPFSETFSNYFCMSKICKIDQIYLVEKVKHILLYNLRKVKIILLASIGGKIRKI